MLERVHLFYYNHETKVYSIKSNLPTAATQNVVTLIQLFSTLCVRFFVKLGFLTLKWKPPGRMSASLPRYLVWTVVCLGVSSTSNKTGVTLHLKYYDPGGLGVERSLGVRKVEGSIPSRNKPKVNKRWYKQLPCLRLALKGECLEIWLVGPVSAYDVTGWGDPVKYLRQDPSSVAAL